MVACLWFNIIMGEDLPPAANTLKSHKLAATVRIKYLRVLQIYTLQGPTVQSEHAESICWQACTVGEGERAKMGTRLRHNLKAATKLRENRLLLIAVLKPID